jgi:hypothetical protein
LAAIGIVLCAVGNGETKQLNMNELCSFKLSSVFLEQVQLWSVGTAGADDVQQVPSFSKISLEPQIKGVETKVNHAAFGRRTFTQYKQQPTPCPFSTTRPS